MLSSAITRNLRSFVFTTVLFPVFLSAQVNDHWIPDKRPAPDAVYTPYFLTPSVHCQPKKQGLTWISAMVNSVNTDSLRSTLQEMQNWGSRFYARDDHRDVAVSLLNRFLNFGYTDVILDSFRLVIGFPGFQNDTTWQYNVVCTVTGKSAPKEVYIVGGHYDSYSNNAPMTIAPGVDDNGTAVAATLEIARVFKQFNYHPETTIKFILFAAEEIGLYGSKHSSIESTTNHEDIRYVLNLDMVSNNPDNRPEIKIFQYKGLEWAGNCAADAVGRYTDLVPVIPADKEASGSDSYPYYLQHFPVTYFEEYDFSPNWHQFSDTLGNCNVPYLNKVTGGALATLAEQMTLPFPQQLQAKSTRDDIVLSWKYTANQLVKGVNIYRSGVAGGPYQKINTSPVGDTVFHDASVAKNEQHYYVIATVNDSLQESLYSSEVSGARFAFCDTLLVLANVKGNQHTPDSILNFYKAVFDTIPYVWRDINDTQKIDMSLVSRYRNILWMANSIDFAPRTDEMTNCVLAHAANRGNLLYTGFNPSKFWIAANVVYPGKVPANSIYREIFQVDSIDRKLQSMMFRANSVATGYDTLHVDPLKYLDKSFRGEIFNIDVFTPAPGASVIYRFDTRYDSTSPFGKMKGRPVGLEYLTSVHNSILLSFPLYYLDTADAREFLYYIITEKFDYPVGMPETQPLFGPDLHVYPNPAGEHCTATFNMTAPGHAELALLSSTGKFMKTCLSMELQAGDYHFEIAIDDLSMGIYFLRFKNSEGTAISKLIKVNSKQ